MNNTRTATRIRRTAIAVAAAAVLPFSLAACSDSGGDAGAAPAAGSAQDRAADTPAAADGAVTAEAPRPTTPSRRSRRPTSTRSSPTRRR